MIFQDRDVVNAHNVMVWGTVVHHVTYVIEKTIAEVNADPNGRAV